MSLVEREWSRTRAVPILTTLLAALVFLPYLGSVGLWDPWETHYAEVAREMISSGDFIHPRWESGWFFSKPALTMWLAVPGLALTGAAQPGGPLSAYTEWLVRLPFALCALLAVALLSYVVARIASRRAGIATGVALSTMPLFFLVARQAMTDMPFVSSLTSSLSCAAIALFDAKTPHTQRWWRAAFALAGIATLAKGVLGLALPLLIVGAWLVAAELTHRLSSERQPRSALLSELSRVPWLSGIALLLGIAVPWYAAMLAFDGRDPEGLSFFQRFFVHDHFARLTRGVHSPTAGGTFVYFIEQAGFGTFPWAALVPVALSETSRARFDSSAPRDRLTLFAFLWVLGTFTLFTSSATRYHHYILPMLPPLAVLLGLTVDRLWDQPWREHAAALLLGAVLTGLVARDLILRPRHLVDLFTYNHDRPYPEAVLTAPALLGMNVKTALAAALLLGGALAGALALFGERRKASTAFGAWALGLALWISWSHWVALSHHWTQRDLFWRYHRLRKANEPIAAFWMDWKGETFYSRNTVTQLKPGKDREQLRELLSPPGRAWVLVEHSRFGVLAQMAGPEQRLTPVDPALNNKFVLVAVDEK